MSRNCTVRIVDEVRVVVSGLHGDHLVWFYDKYGIHAANYFFNPKFKLGQWDGLIHYFKKDGSTYLYLIEEILPKLKSFGYDINLIDERTTEPHYPEFIDENIFAHAIHADTGEPIVLRDYQVSAVNLAIDSGNGIILASTGSGKTFVTAAICYAYGNLGLRTLTIVPNRDLIRQTKSDYHKVGLDTGEYSGKEKTLDHQHIVSTWQALKNNTMIVNSFDVVIVDECHGVKAHSLSSIITDHAANIPHRFGVTGTLPKDAGDLLTTHIALGSTQYEIQAHTLIEREVLSSIQIDVIQLEEDFHKEYDVFCKELKFGIAPTYIQFKDGYFADYDSEKSYIQRKTSRMEWIADLLMTKVDTTGNVLCLVGSIPQGRKLAALIPGALLVNGQDVSKPEKRQEIYDLFKTRDDLIVIGTTHIMGTGISINRIFNLVSVDVGKSFVKVIQGIGRGLRKSEDKNHVNYTDICSDLRYGKKHLSQRISYFKEAKYPFKKYKVDYEKDVTCL
jgi:superfamily II DNA or RNA helicase